ncbi:MAG: D-alanine--D-alanine ligase [Angelakisella sp.]|jgi:D-alanine-D-alanine ligase|nr:D-alanine--D-alanine ligase [Angelakisella sp.]
MTKPVVAILFGGVSSEHEVSCLTAASILENIDRERWAPLAIGITKEGEWFLCHEEISPAQIAGGSWRKDPGLRRALLSPDREHHGLWLFDGKAGWWRTRVDAIFPALHGRNGEDGAVQGLAQLAGIPIVGCGVASSALCMDKDLAKSLLAARGVPVAKWLTVTREARDDSALLGEIPGKLGWPVFVKPACDGSSVGVSRVNGPEGLSAALDAAFQSGRKVIIEEAVTGAEVECAVLGNPGRAVTSAVLGEIVPKRDLYDYEGKYLDGSTDLYIPARIPEEQTEAIKRAALEAYRILECAGLARVDFFALADGSFILNEINTLPGFTSISMWPKLMMASGMTYPEILTRLIELALEVD